MGHEWESGNKNAEQHWDLKHRQQKLIGSHKVKNVEFWMFGKETKRIEQQPKCTGIKTGQWTKTLLI